MQYIIERFRQLAARSFIRRRIALDTSDMDADATFAEFLKQMEPHFTQMDRMRLLTHRSLQND